MLGNFSCIDHFFTNLTDTTALNVVRVDVIDDHVNFSDHKAIMLLLSGDVRKLSTDPIIDTGAGSSTTKTVTLNLDKANVSKYYDLTRISLTPVLAFLDLFSSSADISSDCCTVDAAINYVYDGITFAPISAGQEAFPVHVKKSKKFWWDQSLSAAKDEAQNMHNNWVNAGRPRSGLIFLARNQAKYKYRLHIKNDKKKEKLLVTDRLSSELC